MPEVRMSDEPICDFCSSAKPTHTFHCVDFPMDKSAGQPELRSTGDWLACSACGTYIELNNWDALLLRAVDKLSAKYSNMMPRRILIDTIKRSQDLFRLHYKGAA